jgi:hypothetical protein
VVIANILYLDYLKKGKFTMRVESQQAYSNDYTSIKQRRNSNIITNNEDLSLVKESSKSKNNVNSYITGDIVSYSIVYNKATLENNNTKSLDKSKDDMTDEEITYELNKRIYDHSNLSEKGIKFNSKEFFQYLKAHKKTSEVPYDAPPKIRKALTETLDTLRKTDGVVWFFTIKALGRGLKDCDTTDPKSYLKICDNTIQKNKDEITSLVMSGLANNPLFKDTIRIANGLIDFFTKIRNII